ncbi:MAG TPA: SufD family Fe-S cluster assembly protein, partial [Streptosporangiaceae bacterium]|nr:SufD family Fe-S cluster assembly protein [Streptosporangiaceae bacterium]
MSGLQGAVETAPVSRLHEKQSHDPADFPVPTGREEEWRFTPLRRLRSLHTDLGPGDGKVSVVVADAAPGVTIGNLEHGDPGLGVAYVPADRVSARAFASFREATVVSVPADTESEIPTWVAVRGEGAEGAAFGHTLIDVGANARAVVVLDHSGSATYADNVELVVGDGASLTVVSLQGWADDAVHLSHHHAQLGRDAKLTHTAVTLGGSVVRLAPSVRYTGPGGDAELRGLYFADAGQHLEHRLFVDHAERNCRSRVSYK